MCISFFRIILLFSICFGFVETYPNPNSKKKTKQFFVPLSHDFVRDTIYTNANCILSVNLKTQSIKLHFKDGTTKDFLCSTGNPYLLKGQKTKEGIFVVQYMSPRTYSKQFDSAALINWMGFNHGIGFHALAGRGYYAYLGKKASSHGCIRIKQEDAKYIYQFVKIGTPVIVHSENNARIIDFADSTKSYFFTNSSNLKLCLDYNLHHLYSGNYLIGDIYKLIISQSNITHDGIEIGDKTNIPKIQKLFYSNNFKFVIARDKLKIRDINYEFINNKTRRSK